ncbi:MAG: hypothetical protein JKY66_06965 [Spongiibacteraceae bacterium]|nr:hypothetical protein [Spongiibacteraceae bacterium]
MSLVSAAVLSNPNKTMTDKQQSVTSCHQFTNNKQNPHANTSNNPDQDTSPSQTCCEIDCECNISGCQPLSSDKHLQPLLTNTLQANNLYHLASPQTSNSSLFRPPIKH